MDAPARQHVAAAEGLIQARRRPPGAGPEGGPACRTSRHWDYSPSPPSLPAGPHALANHRAGLIAPAAPARIVQRRRPVASGRRPPCLGSPAEVKPTGFPARRGGCCLVRTGLGQPARPSGTSDERARRGCRHGMSAVPAPSASRTRQHRGQAPITGHMHPSARVVSMIAQKLLRSTVGSCHRPTTFLPARLGGSASREGVTRPRPPGAADRPG